MLLKSKEFYEGLLEIWNSKLCIVFGCQMFVHELLLWDQEQLFHLFTKPSGGFCSRVSENLSLGAVSWPWLIKGMGDAQTSAAEGGWQTCRDPSEEQTENLLSWHQSILVLFVQRRFGELSGTDREDFMEVTGELPPKHLQKTKSPGFAQMSWDGIFCLISQLSILEGKRFFSLYNYWHQVLSPKPRKLAPKPARVKDIPLWEHSLYLLQWLFKEWVSKKK